MTLVVDASCVVAALVDTGSAGRWAESVIDSSHLVAPHLLPAEVANVLRRLARARTITDEVASLAHRDLGLLRVDHVPFEPVAERVWQLRANLSTYDAWYVALAEELDVPLATLDRRLTRVRGLRCRFVAPPAG
jgi:predicted nucleic acid-binding protein